MNRKKYNAQFCFFCSLFFFVCFFGLFVYLYFMSGWSMVGFDIVIQSEEGWKEGDIKSVLY